MCTVSYIPNSHNKDFILTSNRDEKVFRPAFAPDIYESGSITQVIPEEKSFVMKHSDLLDKVIHEIEL